MKTEKLLIVGAVGLVAYVMLSRRSAQPVYQQGQQIPNVSTSISGQAQAQAYYGLGSMIGGIYSKVFGNIGSSANAGGGGYTPGLSVPATNYIPEDGLVVNLPNLYDTFGFENEWWAQP